jgi:hypothetical protein
MFTRIGHIQRLTAAPERAIALYSDRSIFASDGLGELAYLFFPSLALASWRSFSASAAHACTDPSSTSSPV